jgi:two-component system chemotaxis response regulator CheB
MNFKGVIWLITVLVADDSALMRKFISDILNSDPLIKVIGTAIDGEDCIRKCRDLKPDVLTLDIEMPILDGLAVTKQLMVENPIPILLLTGTADTKKTFEGLNLGAIDFLLKPSGNISLDLQRIESDIIAKVKAVYDLRFRAQAFSGIKKSQIPIVPVKQKFHSTSKKIVIIAASTGGPQTIEKLLSQLPKNIPAPILIVQHMPPGFTKGFAQRLNTECSIAVREASDGDTLEDGVALIAPGSFHMELHDESGNYVIRLNQLPSELGVRPNANRLFKSVADIYKDNTIAVVLTGMGFDGTEGSRKIKEYHGLVIAESKNTAIIYGMPKSVVDHNLADLTLDVDNIGVAILQALDV